MHLNHIFWKIGEDSNKETTENMFPLPYYDRTSVDSSQYVGIVIYSSVAG